MAFNNCFFGKKVIVTGNTGFKGSWLSIWLHSLGARVTGISKDIPSEPSLFKVLQLDKKIKHHYADICDLTAMQELIRSVQPDFIFHLAAQPIVSVSYQDPIATLQTNVMGTANILEAMRALTNPCTAVMITSDKCYDNVEWTWGYRETDALGGKDPYSASKGAAELVIKTYFHSFFSKPNSLVKLVAVRAGNVIGGGDWAANRIVPDCVRSWSMQKPVKIRSPYATRPWQHVLEPLSGYLRCAQVLAEDKISITGEAFNFGPNSDQNHTVLELLQAISKFWSQKDLSAFFEIEQATTFHEAGLLKLNCDKALHLLQWRPVLEYAQTASFTGSWYDQYYNNTGTDLYEFTCSQLQQYEELAQKKELAWTR